MSGHHALQAVGRLLPRGFPLPLELWTRRHRAVCAVLWVWVAALGAFGLALGYAPGHVALEVCPVAGPAIVASSRHFSRRTRTVAATFGVLSASGVLVHLSDGYIEAHFAFFAMVSLITLYQSWLPFAVAALYVLVHHGVVGVLYPHEVYNHPSALAHPWRWAAIHALAILAASLAALYAWRVNEEAAAARDDLERRAQEERVNRRRAVQINDDVIQGLVVAKLSLELDEPERATAALDAALRSARGIVGGLLAQEPAMELVRTAGEGERHPDTVPGACPLGDGAP